MSLEQAQESKHELIRRKLGLRAATVDALLDVAGRRTWRRTPRPAATPGSWESP